MRVASALGFLILSLSSVAAPQTPPVRIQPPIVLDTGERGRAEVLFTAYLRNRFKSLGVRVIDSSSSVTSVEVNFSILPLNDRNYDAVAVLTVLNCGERGRTSQCSRGTPFDWMLMHEYRDLEEAARYIAESVYTELESFATLKRLSDSVARAGKH